MLREKCFIFGWMVIWLTGCHSVSIPAIQFTVYEINPSKDTSDAYHRQLYQIYRRREEDLNQVIAFSPRAFWQRGEEPVVSNWLADAVLNGVAKKTGIQPDMVLIPGWVLGKYLPRGNVTKRDILQLIKGDFRWEVRRVSASAVKQYLDSFTTLQFGGVSAGTLIKREQNQITEVWLQNRLLLPSSEISLLTIRATEPYRKKLFSLSEFPMILFGYNIRELVIAYCDSVTGAGLPLKMPEEKRRIEND
ncbi:MAG: hypothetical protein ACKO1T_11675 [Sediminibacterium sp.]